MADPITNTTANALVAIDAPARPAQTSKNPVRIDVPKDVPANIKKMDFDIKTFDVDQLPSTPPVKLEDETGKTKDAKETPVVEKKEEPVVQPKKEEKTGLEGLTKPPVVKDDKAKEKPVVAIKDKMTVTVPDGTQTAQRDYSQYSQDEARVLKQMSNDGFQLTTKLMKENKELGKLKDSTYLQHEHAYILDPQFQKMQTDIRDANVEANHFLAQLSRAEKGETVRDFLGWDAQGKPVLGGEIKADASIVEQLRSKYQTVVNGVTNLKQKAQEIPTKYQAQIKNDMQAIMETSKEMFSWEKDEKLLEHTVPFQYEDGVKDVSLKKIRDDFVAMIPAYMQSHPMTRVAANMAVAIRLGALQLAQAQTQQQVADIQTTEKARGEVSTDIRPTTPDLKEVHGVSEFSGSPV